MTIRDILYRGILHSPDDDTPRLIYADFCDENGEPDRATFVRVQCELSRLASVDPKRCPSCGKGRRFGWRKNGEEWTDCPNGHEWKPASIAALRSRERTLFDTRGAEWFGMQATLLDPPTPSETYRLVVRRGFPAHWHGPWSAWLHADCGKCQGTGMHRYYPDLSSGPNYSDSAGCGYCNGSGRVPGACETMAWRSGWTMECGECRGDGGYYIHKCDDCRGSGRVPRPVPNGALPLTTINPSDMPTESEIIDWERANGGCTAYETHDVALRMFKTRWPDLVFHLPSEREAVPITDDYGGQLGFAE